MKPLMGASETLSLLRRHGIRPKKSLGQHFVIDPNTIRRIVRLAELSTGQNVVEIGAGCGSLTRALASAGCRVLAIETDERLLPPLAEATAGLPVEILHADAARLDTWTHLLSEPPSASEAPCDSPPKTQALTPPHPSGEFPDSLSTAGAGMTQVSTPPHPSGEFPDSLSTAGAGMTQVSTPPHPSGEGWKLVSNLPYNIAAPLLLDVLDEVPQVDEMVVMLQREAAERLASRPGEPAFGLPALKVSYWADAELLGRVPPAAFHPRPRVTSALLRLKRKHKDASAAPITAPYALAKKAYVRRRQMIRRSLRGVVPAEAFWSAGVNPTARPEELSLSDWIRLLECAELPASTPPMSRLLQ